LSETAFIVFANMAGFCVAAVLSYFLTFFFIAVSRQLGLLDYPAEIKLHKKPMPFLGGVGVFLSFWLVIFIGILGAYFFKTQAPPAAFSVNILSGILSVVPKVLGIFLGSVVILVVGLYDDKFRWSPLRKFAGQVAAVLILMSTGLTINFLSPLGLVGGLITFFWILLIINAFNFIDSLDGHCAGIALISAVVFFWITQIIHQPLVGFLLIALAGALMGFFPHNFKPAKTFLGDNGSLFIGYMMAAFTLLCSYQAPRQTYVTSLIPVLIFGVPIYDTLSVVTVRIFRGMPPWHGDRNHFAHRLVKIGMSEKVAVIFSYFVALILGFVAILTTQVDLFGAIIIGFLFFGIIGAVAFLEFYTTERIRIVEELAKKRRRRRADVAEAEEEEL